jgi:hypothetical protein
MNRDIPKPSFLAKAFSLHFRGRAMLVVLFTAALMLVMTGAASATTTFCPTNGSTSWTGGSGDWGTGGWSNGNPTANCSTTISGDVTVTLETTPDPNGQTDSGTTVGSLTLENGATLVVDGVADESNGNWNNFTDLGLNSGGLTIGAGSTLELNPTDGAVGTTPAGFSSGGSVGVIATSGQNTPLNNQGTIITESTATSYGTSINFGGTMTNAGKLDVGPGTLTLQGASPGMIISNSGTLDVASGGNVVMSAGDGSSFTNTGSYLNNGSTIVEDSMYYYAAGGAETGNPIQLQSDQGNPTLDDTSSGAGSYLVDLGGASLNGTIAAGQTVEVQGVAYNCSGNECNNSALYLGGTTVANHGTLILDAPGSGTTSGGISTLADGTLDNYGKLESTVEDSSWHNEIQVSLENEPGGTVAMTGGILDQENGDTATNDGLWQIGPGATYVLNGGNYTNAADGTFQPQISGIGAAGMVGVKQGTFTAGGTIAPELVSGYAPPPGTEFQILQLLGGSFTGTFASTAGSWSSDYSHDMLPNATSYFGVVYAGTASGSGSTSTGGPDPGAEKLAGGAGEIKATITCRKTSKCLSYKLTAKLTEHLKRGKVTAVSARAADNGKKKTVTTRIVTVASASGSAAAGKIRSLTLKLNSTGEALLKRFGKLKVNVTVTAGGKTIKTKTVTVTKPNAKKKRKA